MSSNIEKFEKKKKWNFFLRITQNSDYLKNVCKMQKRVPRDSPKNLESNKCEIKFQEIFCEPWIVKIGIVNFNCKNNFREIFSHDFFSLVINRVNDP